MTRVVRLKKLSLERSSGVPLVLLVCVMLVVTGVQADVEWVDMDTQAQEDWVIHFDIPGSVRHSMDRSYGAAQQRRETQGAQRRRETQGAQRRRGSQGAQQRRASLDAQERRSTQGALERRSPLDTPDRMGSIRHDGRR